MDSRERSLRLFVACELPGEVLEGLEQAQRTLRASTSGLRFVRPEGIHLTLKFLGAVGESRLRKIEVALEEAIGEQPNLRLRASHLGTFEGGQRVRVVWVGVEGDTEGLAVLADRVEGALQPLGFPRERRPFAAHLTLARVRDEVGGPERARIGDMVRSMAAPEMPWFEVRSVALMRSELRPDGAVYTRMAEFPG